MKSILVLFSFFVSSAAFAHCPIPVKTDKGDYCIDVEWQKGDRMVKGALEATDQMSPFLNKMGEVPQKWIYSRALVRMWQNGDKNHVPVAIEGFRIFPYMLMTDGMHHIGTYKFEYSSTEAAYVISGFSLQEMMGCWSLRWTIESDDAVESSALAAPVVGYSNLDDAANLTATQYCDASAPVTPMPGGHHHH
jgi:hypothetical protein